MTFVVPPYPRFIPGCGQAHPRKTGRCIEVPVENAMHVGLGLFRAGYFWEAHEVWEGLWVHEGRTGPTADAVKALIKLAAAGVKIVQRQTRGVESHIDGALELLTPPAERQDGPVQWAATTAGVARWRDRLDDVTEDAWRVVIVPVDPTDAPRDVL